MSALGKKRHRVDIARRLIVGSLVGSFEKQKHILYSASQPARNVLFRVIDSSLPWWTGKDSWSRWSSISSSSKDDRARLVGDTSKLLFATGDTRSDGTTTPPNLTLPQAIIMLEGSNKKDGSQSRSRITATLSPAHAPLIVRPGHALHNSRSLSSEISDLSPSELLQMSGESAGDTSPAHIFSSQ